MSSLFDNLDHVLEVLDDKMVRTDQGSFIRVDDLKDLHRQVAEEAREARENAPRPRPRTFYGARQLAKEDPRLQPPPRPPVAPALIRVNDVVPTEEE